MTKLVNFIVPNIISIEKTIDEILLLDNLGVDILEIAVPIQNPFLDGELIKNCHKNAIKNNTTYHTVIELIKLCKCKVKMEFVLFLYKEVIDEKFYISCSQANIRNLLICDLQDDDLEIKENLKAYNLNSIVLLNPQLKDSTILEKIASSQYFIYLTSHTNPTGSKTNLDYALLEKKAQFIKENTKTPLFIGFSIDSIEQVKVLKNYFDGIIIGSKILSFLVSNRLKELKLFLENIKKTI